jgi:lipopolysaccharide/colanic/teichoic acid biosynthesis glycosyltransferase
VTILSKFNKFIKRLIDILSSIFLIILLSPLLILIAIFIKLDTEGPVLFKQKRLGKGGRKFVIYKFRTMIENAENMGTGLDSYKNDFRVTSVGKLLRNSSLDELPQLINIIKGDMSLVGPRPPVTYHPHEYSEYSNYQKKRFEFLPGVTGYAQINGRNELSWDEKIDLDIEYINLFKKYGIIIDIYILILTVIKVFKMEGSYDKQ